MGNNISIYKKPTIFVTIAACQEYFIEHTIKSAMSLAIYPERVYFGVFNNILNKEKSLIDKDFFNNNPQIFYAELITGAPMGVGFGRMNASLLSTKDHDYVLQIDAHTVFTKGWDLQLIQSFEHISEKINSDNLVLTAIPRGNLYYHPSDRDILFSDDDVFSGHGIETIDIYNNEYHKFTDCFMPYHNTKPEIRLDGWQGNHFTESMVGFPITYGTEKFDEDYAEVNCIHASLLFYKYTMIREILHDPFDTFHGDQVNYGLRLLSRGYKIFAIKEPLLLTLDKYKKHHSLNSEPGVLVDPEWNWRANKPTQGTSKEYLDRAENASHENYVKIFNGSYTGYWGAPDQDSLKYAKRLIGLDKTMATED